MADAITNTPLLEHKKGEKKKKKKKESKDDLTLSEGDRMGQALLYSRNPR